MSETKNNKRKGVRLAIRKNKKIKDNWTVLDKEQSELLKTVCFDKDHDSFTKLTDSIKKKMKQNLDENKENVICRDYYQLLNDCFLITLSNGKLKMANIIINDFRDSPYSLYDFYDPNSSLQYIKNAIQQNYKNPVVVEYLKELLHDVVISETFYDFLIEYTIENVRTYFIPIFFNENCGILKRFVNILDGTEIIKKLIFQIYYKNKKESFKLLIERIHHEDYMDDKIRGAVKGLHLDLIQDLIEQTGFIYEACSVCLKHNYAILHRTLLYCAMDNQALPIVKYLATKNCVHNASLFFTYALIYSQFDIINWIIDEKIEFNENILNSEDQYFSRNNSYDFNEYFDVKSINSSTDYIFIAIKYDINLLNRILSHHTRDSHALRSIQVDTVLYLIDIKKIEINYRHAIYIMMKMNNYKTENHALIFLEIMNRLDQDQQKKVIDYNECSIYEDEFAKMIYYPNISSYVLENINCLLICDNKVAIFTKWCDSQVYGDINNNYSANDFKHLQYHTSELVRPNYFDMLAIKGDKYLSKYNDWKQKVINILLQYIPVVDICRLIVSSPEFISCDYWSSIIAGTTVPCNPEQGLRPLQPC